MSSDKKDNGLGDKPKAEDATGAAAPGVAETGTEPGTPKGPDDAIEDAEIVAELGPRAEADWEEPGVDPYGADPAEDDADLDAAEIVWEDESDLEEIVAPGIAEETHAEAAEASEVEDEYLTPGVTADEDIPEQPAASWPGAATVAAAGAGMAAAAMADTGSGGGSGGRPDAGPSQPPTRPRLHPHPHPPLRPRRGGAAAASSPRCWAA